MKCLKDRCLSPVACGGFGYCRERNQDGYPMDEANMRRRLQSEQREVAKFTIACILDRHSVYMSGPSQANQRNADQILKYLEEEGLIQFGSMPETKDGEEMDDDQTNYEELRASLARNITLLSHHQAALLRLVDAKIAERRGQSHLGDDRGAS